MHEAGLQGRGIYCAVIDASFWGVARSAHFDHLFEEDRIVDTYSWLHHSEQVYGQKGDIPHGAMALSVMAGESGLYRGAAQEAYYTLYETENIYREYRIEEYNWLFAAERAGQRGRRYNRIIAGL